MSLNILMPVLDDWTAAELVLRRLDDTCAAAGLRPRVLLVDDGSTHPVPASLGALPCRALEQVEILRLHANMGHQRAICTGLAHLASTSTTGAVVVMDSDGEDDPSHVPLLVARYRELGEGTAVFAARARRSESWSFRLFYALYRLAHRLLVGLEVRIGNFSVLPMATVHRLVRTTDLWNHYAAATVRSRSPLATLPLDRAARLHGRSQMGFGALVVLGLSAMAVFGQTVAVRLLLVTFGLAVTTILGLGAVVGLRLFTGLAIPGWATSAAGLLLVLLLQALIAATIFSLSLLAGRTAPVFVPVRDCGVFVASLQRVAPRP